MRDYQAEEGCFSQGLFVSQLHDRLDTIVIAFEFSDFLAESPHCADVADALFGHLRSTR